MTVSGSLSHPLTKSRLLAGLDETAIQHVQDAARVRRIGANQGVTTAGERPDYMFLLHEGRAKLYNVSDSGSEVVLMWNVPGEIIGLVSLLPNPPEYIASSRTVSECEFLVWDHATIRGLVKAYPRIMENGLRISLDYLDAFISRHASVMTKSAELRLAQALCSLALKAGEVQPTGVKIDITNEHLSSLSDISPFTASRLLSKWERDGKLRKQRGHVILRSPESLMVIS
jgi:CRP-like cAMP-binding protein